MTLEEGLAECSRRMTLDEVMRRLSGLGGHLYAGGRIFAISHYCDPGPSDDRWHVEYPDERKDAVFLSAEDAVRSCIPDGSDMDGFLSKAYVLIFPG